MNNGINLGSSLSLVLASLLALAPSSAAQPGSGGPPGQRRESKPGPPTAAPTGPVRCIGEWEESEGVLMLWRNADLIRKLAADNHVYIPVRDEESRQDWLAWLKEKDVPTDDITLLDLPARRMYTRDFGPFFVWDGDNEIGVVDYHYGRGRDRTADEFNKKFCELYGIHYYYSGIKHVGGNYLPNGYGTSFSSTHVFEQNPDSTKAKIIDVMEEYFGVEHYPTLSPKTIWHHDTWGKPCSPDTLIVVEFPEDDVYKHAAANDTVAYYETLESPWGRPYTIHRLPMFGKERSSRWERRPPSIFDMPGGSWYGGNWGPPGGGSPPTPPATPPATPTTSATPAAAPALATDGPPTGGAGLIAARDVAAGDAPVVVTAADERGARADHGATRDGTPKPGGRTAESAEEKPEEKPEEKESIVDPSWDGDLAWNEQRGPYYRPYMNSLISNGRVYVPVDDCPDDEVALAVFRKAFPGYDVVGVDSGGTYSSDSLHCRTRNFMRRDPIRIYPYPPGDTEETEQGYTVTAEVIPPNGNALLEGQPVVRWSETGGEPFEPVVMEATDDPHFYRAVIPARPHGTTISFYVEARDDGKRRAVYPPVAPRGLMSFEVRKDRRRPQVSCFNPTRVAGAGDWPPPVRLLAKDDMATPAVRIEYEINGEEQDDVVLAREPRTYWYSGALGAKAAPGDIVSYRVVAADGSKAGNESNLPRFGKVYCRVTESAEIGVVDMTERGESGAFITQALGDLEVTSRLYDAWPADWDAHDVWFVCLGVFADNHVLSEVEAADVVAALDRGKSIYLEGGDTWCHDPQGEKLNPYFGVEKLERGRGFEELEGEPRSIVGGMTLEYVGENLFTDRIGAVPPATLLFSSHRWKRGRAVLHETGSYRTIASTFSLAGLLDGKWPNNRKEILVRCLEFLADTDVKLRTAGTAHPGDEVPVRIEGKPGDRYILLASRSEYHAELPGYGVLRLDPAHLYHLSEGRIPRSGVVRYKLEVPEDADCRNVEIHCQALVGKTLEPGSAKYTNRDILKLCK